MMDMVVVNLSKDMVVVNLSCALSCRQLHRLASAESSRGLVGVGTSSAVGATRGGLRAVWHMPVFPSPCMITCVRASVSFGMHLQTCQCLLAWTQGKLQACWCFLLHAQQRHASVVYGMSP